MRSVFMWVLVLITWKALPAQAIDGVVRNVAGEPVRGATVMLRRADSSRVLHYAVSDAKGRFRISFDGQTGYVLRVQHVSYDAIMFPLDPHIADTVRIMLEPRKQELKEVVVKTQLPVLVRNDTVIYNATSYASPDVRKVEELLGRMQGFGVSADGRITYNGKPVEKVLVDGEDIAGKGYQLLTRNLGAGYVDKVEVITNFSTNRLVGALGRQDAVGVNLRIKQKYKGKLSGSLDAAYGGRRYHGSGNVLSLHSRYKAFAFADANNVAEDVMGSLANIAEGEGFPDGGLTGTIETGKLIPPSLNDRYRKDNKDAAAAAMFSWRTGPKNRMRALGGYLQQKLVNRGRTEVSSQLNDSVGWRVNNDIREENELGSSFLKVVGQRDDSLGRIDDYFLDLRYETPGGSYLNFASVDLKDSLRERLLGERRYAGAGWKATRGRQGRALLQVNTEGYFLRSPENFRFQTGRYAGYFGLPASYDQGQQANEQRRLRITSDAVWLRSASKTRWQYGLSAFFDRSRLRASTRISAVLADSSYTGTGRVISSGANINLRRTIAVGKNADLSFGARAGPRFAASMYASSIFLGGDAGADYVRRFSALRVFRARVSAKREIPDLLNDMPAPVLSGNATILEGLDLTRPLLSGELQASFFSNNIRRQMNWSASLIFSTSPSAYNASVEVDPAYTASLYQNERGGLSLLMLTGAEKYVAAVKGKLGMSMVANLLENRFRLNNQPSLARNASAQGEAWWISGFRNGLGLESRFRLGWYFSGMAGTGGATVLRSGYSQKLLWRPHANGFLTLVLNGTQLGSGSWFHGLDCFAQWRPPGRLSMHVKAVNILNAGMVREKAVYPYSYSINAFRLVQRYLMLGLSLGMK